ncbi:MAG: YbaB/EbfC family nucleoid-associated protein [Candidatus Nephthysia bennettiae]|uniref:Nucleoid-associated protein JF922_20420 n=1 Tax=Candidatus Nephthysia bennettiae TaxID=3127016 RepID=A0A934NAV9_9BACT|nr:YbaB/EbfC family nucleoid-associated protein [Candidatus Dormibacteraeota bacterium]MBJ7611669.1 YbaB/EbfC family nucleoid-associated protein [Candidatus Dormibacteraeota bacterium]PZR92361.1 MAG: YbaB/EbfC family nucleoid-associated protein [Candidatus Dormibacteraeota bacterium]
MQNPMKMMQQVQKMQSRMAKVQEELENEQIEAAAGGGVVRVVVNGQQKLLSITVDPEVAGDVEMLQDLVVAAVNEALDQSRELAASRMQEVTAGLGLPPGLV